MLNCGLTDLRLVKPRDGWPNERAQATASGAAVVLEAAQQSAAGGLDICQVCRRNCGDHGEVREARGDAAAHAGTGATLLATAVARSRSSLRN